MNKRQMFLAILAGVFICCAVHGQSTRVELSGVVHDPAGVPVAGASVDLRNADTSVSTSRMTDSSGIYRFIALLPGNYELSVRKEGFSTLRRAGLTFRIGEQVSLDLSLSVGNLAQSVDVTESVPLLQAARGTV